MRRFAAFLSFFTLLFLSAFPQCDLLMELSKESLDARDYQLAIERLLDAKDECQNNQEEINGMIKQAFALIQEEKENAEKAKLLAESLQLKADSTLSVLLNTKEEKDQMIGEIYETQGRIEYIVLDQEMLLRDLADVKEKYSGRKKSKIMEELEYQYRFNRLEESIQRSKDVLADLLSIIK